MGSDLPPLDLAEMARQLRRVSPAPLDGRVVERLHAHYEELRRWNPRLSLVGPGTASEVVSRHYGESLAALPWFPPDSGGALVDLGSGGGFPGWVLAAARPDWDSTLVEARERKWAFLVAASRRAGLSVRCLDARVGPRLPEGFPRSVDRLTLRALKVPDSVWTLLDQRLAPEARVLWWAGEDLSVPSVLTLEEKMGLPGAERRYLWVARKTDR